MTQEQFEALGIEKSLAKKAADESKKELEAMCRKRTMTRWSSRRNSWKPRWETIKHRWSL